MIKENKLLLGDCLDKLKELDDNSIDSIVSDPPYGLAFMGKKWDYDVPSQAIWEECMRVLKPGGHLLSFAGSRTYHRMAVRIEDAGFEIRDQIMWVYGSGFPKSHNVANGIDKKNGAGNRGHAISSGNKFHPTTGEARANGEKLDKYEARTEEGKGWEGWGTALKPAHEPIVMARKPFKGTVADNVLEWGTGGINIDGCRVGYEDTPNPATNPKYRQENGYKTCEGGQVSEGAVAWTSGKNGINTEGRFPANIIFECTCDNPKVVADKYDIRTYNDYKNTFQSYEENDKDKGKYEIKDVETTKVIHTDPNCPCYILDQQSGDRKGMASQNCNNQKLYGGNAMNVSSTTRDGFKEGYNDTGGASRFFYCPKASKKDRDEGLEVQAKVIQGRDAGQDKMAVAYKARPTERQNIHPTVKPTDLMQYLIRLVTKKGGVVLDPFMGSGSTGKAAIKEGMIFVGIEREEEYFEIAKQRIENEIHKNEPKHHFW